MEKAAVVALEYEGKTLALVRSPEVFEHRKEERATRTFGINADRGHPSASPAVRCLVLDVRTGSR